MEGTDCIACAEGPAPPNSVLKIPESVDTESVSSYSPQACARVMPPSFQAKSGVEVFDGIFLGRELGAGMQAKVFELVRADGSSIGKVLKIGHSDLSHKLLYNQFASSMLDLQHEWELGMQLKAALEQPDGSLPGFTRTCDCMVVMKDDKHSSATFQGMIMEKLNGWPISKRITDPSFHNIHYIREMLFQVLSALDRGQRALGFNHADLGLNNVMEHYPTLFPDVQQQDKEANAEALKICSACGPCSKPGELMPGRSMQWRRSSVGTGCSAPPPISGFSCDADGKLLPLGPHVEFKIIDYGVGEFNEVLAQAAGGHEPEATLKQIQDVFAAKGIPLGAESKRQIIDMVNGSPEPKRCKLQQWKLSPFGNSGNRFMATPELKRTASAMKATSSRGPVERMYRHFWERKGDVFHLLLALAVALDDRVWPKEDERDVQLFASLVHHVTGAKLRAFFASKDDPKRIKVMGKTNRRERKGEMIGDASSRGEALYGARVRCFTWWRRTRIMMGAHLKPFNSGLLAGEALVSPFFGFQSAPHAELPVCVEAAFPFRPAQFVKSV